MNNSTVDQWLQFAPRPEPLSTNKHFHVFISYRSINRLWVLQLYDILRDLGYEVFLDQYVLAAAAPLALSLNDALDNSMSAIMIWSSSFEDSEWCKKEYNTLEVKENAANGFRYVVAKIDEKPLPAFASGKIHVDFSKDRDGPNGSGLLRLLHGLQGNPLPAEAVRLAAMVDSELITSRAKIKAARINGDVDRLLALAESTELAWLTSSVLGCEVADALIGLKQNEAALNLLVKLEQCFPRALRPKQLQGLALARSNHWQEAQSILGELYAAGEIDPETLGIYGRTWMDRYNATGQKLYLLKSRDLYRQAFEAAPGDYYTGINAATKSLFLEERETASQLAKRVESIVGTKPDPKDYWKTATIAEVQLLQGNFEKAAELYQEAVLAAPEDHGSHESTCKQASLILDKLQTTPDIKQKLLSIFG